jgi:isoleucyl-tRNA synthetase
MQQRLAERGLGGEKSNYKIQDWVFSRQRYWGEPFPVVFCKHCGEKALEKHLHTINFYDQATRNGIKTKLKTIETRALNPEEPEKYFGNAKIGDVLKMVNKETDEVLYGKITEKFEWKNFEELFSAPVLADIYRNKEQVKSVKTVDDLKKGYNFTP